jgi:hypothetical protein
MNLFKFLAYQVSKILLKYDRNNEGGYYLCIFRMFHLKMIQILLQYVSTNNIQIHDQF